MYKYICDKEKAVEQIAKFVLYVKHENNGCTDLLSFNNKVLSNGKPNFLFGEHYKKAIPQLFCEKLNLDSWDYFQVGDGVIGDKLDKTITSLDNLVSKFQMIQIGNNTHGKRTKDSEFDPEYLRKVEEAIYSIYLGRDDRTAFEYAIEVFGRKYDLIAGLFFTKNGRKNTESISSSEEYLPIKPGQFGISFSRLGIENIGLSGKCSWENYNQYIAIINEVKDLLNEHSMYFAHEIDLLDAHSFCYIVGSRWFNEFQPDKKQQAETKDDLSRYGAEIPRSYDYRARGIERKKEVADAAKMLANGHCRLCGKEAPFKDKKGNPYLESHHVIWLSKGGADKIYNVVALCPNCHTKMHTNPDEDEVEMLRHLAQSQK